MTTSKYSRRPAALERLLDPSVAVRHDAEPEPGGPQPAQRLVGVAGERHQRCRSLCSRARQSAHLGHPLGRHAGAAEERLEVDRARAPGRSPARPFHGPGRLGPTPAAERPAGQRHAERRADRRGHAGIIEEQERVPGVEQNRPQRRRRADRGAQRKRSSAPSPSMRVARLGLVHHVDVHPLPQRLLDRVVHDVEHRHRLALAAAFALGQRQAAGVAAAEAGLAGVGVHQQRAHLPARRAPAASGVIPLTRPAAPHALQHLVHQRPLRRRAPTPRAPRAWPRAPARASRPWD